jgi:GNAT superfamily N-acetyltransferase
MKYLKKYNYNKLKYKLEGNYINYFIDDNKIGYIEYYYDGGCFSENLPNKEKEFYIAMIKVFDIFKGNDYSTRMLNTIKEFAKQKGATIITLRIDNGMGFSKRQSDSGLEKLYLKNGFKYQHTEDESRLDDTKNLGAMYYKIKF